MDISTNRTYSFTNVTSDTTSAWQDASFRIIEPPPNFNCSVNTFSTLEKRIEALEERLRELELEILMK